MTRAVYGLGVATMVSCLAHVAKYSSNSVVQPSRVMHAGQATRAVYGLGVVTMVSCLAH